MINFVIHKHTIKHKNGNKTVHYDLRFWYKDKMYSYFTKRTSDGVKNKLVSGIGFTKPKLMMFKDVPHKKSDLTFEGKIKAGEYGGGYEGGFIKILHQGEADIRKLKSVKGFQLTIKSDKKKTFKSNEIFLVAYKTGFLISIGRK